LRSLEERLNARLVNRTTRSVVLTDLGRVYLERSQAILGEIDELEAAIQGLHATPRGTLRVSAPQDFGRLFLCGAVAQFVSDYPELRVEFELTDRLVDVVDEGFDVALRISELKDSSLTIRRLGVCERVLCASPTYLERYSRPRRPAELDQHNCIEYEYLAAPSGWRFRDENGRARSMAPTGRLRANSGWAMREMALAGHGIALLPIFLIANDLEGGRLETVLDDSLDADMEVMTVIPHRKQVAAKVRAFIDFLVENLDANAWIRAPDKHLR